MGTPEDEAREKIEQLLDRCGWQVQDKNAANLSASRGVAVLELSFETGESDWSSDKITFGDPYEYNPSEPLKRRKKSRRKESMPQPMREELERRMDELALRYAET